MNIDPIVLSRLLAKLSPRTDAAICDHAARIVAAAAPEYPGAFSLGAFCPEARAAMDNGAPEPPTDADDGGYRNARAYAVPIAEGDAVRGAVAVRAGREKAENIAGMIKAAVEALLDYGEGGAGGHLPEDPRCAFFRKLLAASIDEHESFTSADRLEIDPQLLRAVVCIRLDYQENTYFNVNLNLGYQSAGERLRADIVERIKALRYLTTQDVCFSVDAHTVVLVKSFLAASERTKIHAAIERICGEMELLLSGIGAASFGMASGSIRKGLTGLKSSFEEALEIIAIGAGTGKPHGYYRLGEIAFETLHRFMHELSHASIIEPYLERLPKKDGRIKKELVDCAELFVDSCMNMATASRKGCLHRNTIASRLRALEVATGLDPSNSFRDAFVVKMLAVHIRRHRL